MSMDEHDIEWRCGCGSTNPDFNESCGCGQERYPEEKEVPVIDLMQALKDSLRMELASEPVSRGAHNPESEVRLLGEPSPQANIDAGVCLICGEWERECVCSEETKAHHAEYRTQVEVLLTTGKSATRSQRPGCRGDDWPMSDVEVQEMTEAYLLGTLASDFAKRLEGRDIALFEKLDDPYPDRAVPFAANH